MRNEERTRGTPACGKQGHGHVILNGLEAGGDGINDHTFTMFWAPY
jgi:hypothetical protein